MMDLRFIVYRTENKINHKFYYGVHDTLARDKNYFGSGVAIMKALKRYGKHNFTRTTIISFKTLQEAFIFEGLLVDKQMIDDPKCYNLALGGRGGFTYTRTDEHRKKISEVMKGKTNSESTKAKMRASNRDSRKVINTATGEGYDSIKHAATLNEIPHRTLSRWLIEKPQNNKSNLRLLI